MSASTALSGSALLVRKPGRADLHHCHQLAEHLPFVAGGLIDPDQLIELEMQRRAIAVLCILDKKHHEKCDDGCARIDYELPNI